MGDSTFGPTRTNIEDGHRWRERGHLPAYRHYRVDGSGKITGADWIEALDEEEAVRQVRDLELRSGSELWDGERLIAKVAASTG